MGSSLPDITGTHAPACICMSPTEPGLVGVSSAVIGLSLKQMFGSVGLREGAHMEVLFVGAEVVFVFCSSLVEGSCVSKQVDNPAEMASPLKSRGVTRTLCALAVSGAYSSPPTCCHLLPSLTISRK